MKFLKSVFLLLLSGLVIHSCSDKSSPTGTNAGERGTISHSSLLAKYPVETIQLFTEQQDSIAEALHYDITAIKIEYQTIDWNSDPTVASGVLIVPDTTLPLPIASVQHGTVFQRDAVASAGLLDSREGLAGLAFASAGFVTLLPDYLGYGVSEMMHPYLVADANAEVVIDFIYAARKWCEKNDVTLNGQLFLGGYSEGGYITLATQKAIETDPAVDLQLTVVAPCAGPYDLSGMVQRIGQRMSYPEPAFLSFMLTAYNKIYGWNQIEDIFEEPYANQMTELFNGTHNSNDIDSVLPDSISQLLKPEFIQSILNGENQPVIQAFQENTLLDWTPEAPIRFFHGEADQVVDVENARVAQQQLTANGGQNITLKTYPGLGHSEAAIPAYLDMFDWFSSFLPRTKISQTAKRQAEVVEE